MAIAATGVIALALRLLQFTRGGSLTGIVEYDDGPYVGSAILLTHGILPYRDYIFVQPPGITLIMAPVAVLARVGLTGMAGVMATGRVLTAVASAAGVVLLGLLVRHRGVAAVVIAGGVLAVYTGSIEAAHTVLVEPWVVVFCLAGALLVFSGDGLASSRRLVWGGVLFGFAGAIEIWAVVLVLVITALCLPQARRAARFLAGAAAGFVVPVLPFALASPRGFYAGVVTAQIGSRRGAIRVSPLYRFKLMTGLDWVHPWSALITALVALAVAGAVLGLMALAGLLSRSLPPPLDAFAACTTALTVIMFLVPSQFHYHFTGFLGPFLAASLALPAARCAAAAARLLPGPAPGSARASPQAILAAAAAPILLALAVVQGHALTGQPPYMTVSRAADRLIPRGACVLSDTAPVLIVSGRLLSTRPGCITLLDSMGADLELSHGLRPDTGAWRVPVVEEMWWRAFRHAQFVWLKYNSEAPPRVPWTPALRAYFADHFRLVLTQKATPSIAGFVYGLPQTYKLYARTGRRAPVTYHSPGKVGA